MSLGTRSDYYTCTCTLYVAMLLSGHKFVARVHNVSSLIAIVMCLSQLIQVECNMQASGYLTKNSGVCDINDVNLVLHYGTFIKRPSNQQFNVYRIAGLNPLH